MSGRQGNLGDRRLSPEEALASMASLYDMRALSISGLTGDLVWATTYAGYELVNIFNNSATDPAAVIVKTKMNSGTNLTLNIKSYSVFPIKLPPIHTIVQSGTADNLILCIQKKG